MFRTKSMLSLALLLVLLAAPAFAFLGGNKFEKEVEKEASAIKLTRETIAGGYDLVSTSELQALLDSGKDVLVIDTMPYEDSYKKNHVPGAKQFLFPIPLMESWDNEKTAGKSQEEFIAMLGDDKEKTIVIYCGFVKCTRSHNGALWAKKLGYKNVYRYPGGIFAWKGAGLEVGTVE